MLSNIIQLCEQDFDFADYQRENDAESCLLVTNSKKYVYNDDLITIYKE